MTITLNGKTAEYVGETVAELLAQKGYKTRFVAVEQNGVIIKRAGYDTAKISDGDTIEVVNFVGGG